MSKKHKKKLPPEKCAWCAKDLIPEEIAESFDAGYGVLCFGCEVEEHYQDCDICSESYPEAQFGKVIAVFDVDKAFRNKEGKKPGLYRVKRKPYYISNYFNAWLIERAVEYAAPLPPKADGDRYSCGDVCEDCIRRYLPGRGRAKAKAA
jgi:hypothetical protein